MCYIDVYTAYMCGIFAYTGKREAAPILLEGLKVLEYRGYDSAGVFVLDNGTTRAVGAVAELEKLVKPSKGTVGIAHTRWATHGAPSIENSHPHADCNDETHIVHNGIIENYRELKKKLEEEGHTFSSETDSEVLAHLIEREHKSGVPLLDAVCTALSHVYGAYAIAVTSKKEPGTIVGARLGSPLVVGIADGELFLASDPSPLLPHTREVLYLEDGECAVLSPSGYKVVTHALKNVDREPDHISWNVEEAQKGGHPHFMLKEILEEPEAVESTLRGRVLPREGKAKLGGLESVAERLKHIRRVMLVACGTASYAGLAGKYMLEEYAGIPAEVDIASEFRYRKPILDEETALIAVSQSGETADTLEAIREGKRRGALTLGLVNVVGSTIAREVDAGVYLHAGPEVSVASTKAYLSQLTSLVLLTLFLGRQRNMTAERGKEIAQELLAIPEKIKSIFEHSDAIRAAAEKYADAEDFLFIGRKYNYATAFEGALKLKETSYIHGEACGAGEMKHGHLAMIDEHFPTIAIAPSDSVYEKVVSNIQEIRTRNGPVLAIATEGNGAIASIVSDVLYVPKTIDILTPLLTVVPLHLFAYYFAVQKGYNVDRPRNLAKSVTVE